MNQTTVQPRYLERAYALVLLVIFGGIVLHAPLSVALGTVLPDFSLLFKSWKEILMVLLVPVAIWMIIRHKLWKELCRDWVFRLIVAYVALHCLVSVVLYKGLQPTAAGLAIDLRYIVYFSLVYILVRIYPRYRTRILLVWLIGAGIVIGFGVVQLFLPADILKYIGYSQQTIAPYLTVDQNHAFIRINSTLRGPNPLGAYALIVLALLAAAALRQKKRLHAMSRRWQFTAAVVASGIVLWVSYSRSAQIGVVVALGIIVAATIGRRLPVKWWLLSCVMIAALAGGLVAARGNAFISTTLLHDDPHGVSLVSSNEGHVESLQIGLGDLLHRPFGSGVGSTGSASLYGGNPTIIENQYLFIGHEVGWIGIILFIAIFVLILRRAWRDRHDWLALGVFASGVGLALVGLLLPVWVDDTVSIIWWGLAAVVLANLKVKESV